MGLSTLSKIRQQEYTGENRCPPCTMLNLIIAAALGRIVAQRSRTVGWAVFLISSLLIYLRGYLIPGTPTLTQRYLPTGVSRLLGKGYSPETERAYRRDGSEGPAGRETDENHADGAGTLDEHLLSLDVIQPDQNGTDLRLATDFARDWTSELRATDTISPDDVAAVFNLSATDLTIRDRVEGYVVSTGDYTVGEWPSSSALLADIAAGRAVEDYYSNWHRLSTSERYSILSTLRIFVPECPRTGGPITERETTVSTCCQSYEVTSIVCEESGEPLVTQSFER